jgi:hypothetical protein
MGAAVQPDDLRFVRRVEVWLAFAKGESLEIILEMWHITLQTVYTCLAEFIEKR